MAKVSYRRLAIAMVEMLDRHTIAEVAAAAVQELSASGHRQDLDRLIPELERELARQKNHVVIHATMARQLPQDVLNDLAAELTERVGGNTYELETDLDASLLGGVRLSTSDASLDLSLRNRLETIRTYHG